ncbi:MAG: hypothetical protein OXH01_02915 [Bacteroidetes bacterium]|nr:hypothetical protein [Bacteroidota bacterium]
MHTTAGFLEQSLATKLGNKPEGVDHLVRSAHRLFPEGAPYWHDRMELRNELTAEQRKFEPLNADSHLAFICLGLCSCALYEFDPDDPIYFIDLDGEFQGTFRSRKTLAVGYNETRCVHEDVLSIRMPRKDQHALDLSQHLNDLQALVNKHNIHRGLVTFELDSNEKNAGITVNEYETLLVERDITDVLKNPLRYMLDHASELVRHPLTLPGKAKKVLTYELHLAIRDGLRLASRSVSAVEYMVERLGMRLPLLESVIDRLATPLETRWMNLGTTARFLINAGNEEPHGRITTGTYQSPILIQWRRPDSDMRNLRVRLLQFV